MDELKILDQIHLDALRVLEETGVKCASTEVRQIFEETGLAAFDESTGHIHVLTPLVEQALKRKALRNQVIAFGVIPPDFLNME